MSSVEGESNSDNEDQSLGDPVGPPGKRRMRKIPKLPMVRHGKKWYRARLLKDSGQGRVQIGNAWHLSQASHLESPAAILLCMYGAVAALPGIVCPSSYHSWWVSPIWGRWTLVGC